jgi:lipid-binding SYLF domain-containing protein
LLGSGTLDLPIWTFVACTNLEYAVEGVQHPESGSRWGTEKMTTKFIWVALIAFFAIGADVQRGEAASAREIDASVDHTMQRFFDKVGGARELAHKAVGILVFPSVVKAGFGVGGEYGEGSLHVKGGTVGYYNTVSASFGFQLGVQERSVIILFMNEQALNQFRKTAGWKVGVDGSIAIITLGAGGSIDTNKITSPVVGFILDPKGLMYNLTLEGSKISRISR